MNITEEIYEEIRLVPRINTITAKANRVTIDNLHMSYAKFGVSSAANVVDLTVQNCEFSWIKENCIELYRNAKDSKVDNCYFSQSYKAAIFIQNSTSASITTTQNADNVIIKNNVVEGLKLGFSISYGQPRTNTNIVDTSMNALCIENNIISEKVIKLLKNRWT